MDGKGEGRAGAADILPAVAGQSVYTLKPLRLSIATQDELSCFAVLLGAYLALPA
jgi:hypothetical protein